MIQVQIVSKWQESTKDAKCTSLLIRQYLVSHSFLFLWKLPFFLLLASLILYWQNFIAAKEVNLQRATPSWTLQLTFLCSLDHFTILRYKILSSQWCHATSHTDFVLLANVARQLCYSYVLLPVHPVLLVQMAVFSGTLLTSAHPNSSWLAMY